MAKQESDVVGKFALAVTVVGLGSYLVLSSGIFSALWSKKEKKPSPEAQLQEKVKEWRSELEQISTVSAAKQVELEDLTSRLARIRLEVQKQSADLGRMREREPQRLNRRRSVEVSREKFRSISDLRKFLSEVPEEQFEFSTQAGSGGLVYQNVSMGRPFAENSIFLRRAGLKWAQAVSKAAVDLQARDLIIRYVEGKEPLRKAQVLQDYLEEQLQTVRGDAKTSIAVEAVSRNEVNSESQVDLLLAFESSAQ